MWYGTIDYKQLHKILLKRRKEIEEESLYNENYAAEIVEIDTMLISIRNMYRRVKNLPIRWKFGEIHPYIKIKE